MRGSALGFLLLWLAVVTAAQTQNGDPEKDAPINKEPSEPENPDQPMEGEGMKTEGEGKKEEGGEGEKKEGGEGKKDQEDAIDTNVSNLDEKDRFFLGRYSTTTETAVVMVTSTVFFSCLSGTSAAVCLGRRRKRAFRSQIALEDTSNNPNLESSQSDAPTSLANTPEAETKENDGKLLGFQVWTRVRTTTTVTMLFTDTNTTIRLSYYCQAGLAQLPQFNCVG